MSLVLVLLVGCSDYEVAHSDLVAQGESGEVRLAVGEARQLLVRMDADAEAMAPEPRSRVELTVFAVQDEGSPRLYASTPFDGVDSGVAPTVFLELRVDEPFRGCADPDVTEPPADVRADGSCVVELPVDFRVEGGSVSFQLDAYVQLDFASNDPPGALSVVVETGG